MESSSTQSDMRIGLFIDVENLVRSAETIGLPIDVEPVLQKLKQYGRVQVRRSFGDLERNIHNPRDRQGIRKMLHRNLVLIEDVPFMTLRKNTADIRLVVEALSLAYQNEAIDCFAIVASDRDYVPLFNKLRELGRTTIGIGIDQENVNPNYGEACDILLYYESFFGRRQPASLDETDTGVSKVLEFYYDLLCRAITTLEERGQKTVGAAVAPMMRQLRSDFDPNLAGCETFKDFIQKAEGEKAVLVEWPSGPGDLVLAVNPEKDRPSYEGQQRQAFVAQEPQEEAANFKRVLESKMKVPVPALAMRRRILDALAAQYDAAATGGHASLRDWSVQAYETGLCDVEGIEQTAVFKILLSLYFARCFQCRQTEEQFNPIILSIACDPSAWEERLHHQFLRSIRYEDQRLVPTPEGVSLFLHEDREHIDEAERIIDEVWNR